MHQRGGGIIDGEEDFDPGGQPTERLFLLSGLQTEFPELAWVYFGR